MELLHFRSQIRHLKFIKYINNLRITDDVIASAMGNVILLKCINEIFNS